MGIGCYHHIWWQRLRDRLHVERTERDWVQAELFEGKNYCPVFEVGDLPTHREDRGKNYRDCVRAELFEWKNCSCSVFEVNLREEERHLLVTREGLCHRVEL